MFTSTITLAGRLAEDPTVLENLTEFVILTNRRKADEAGEWANDDTSGSRSRRSGLWPPRQESS